MLSIKHEINQKHEEIIKSENMKNITLTQK